MRCNNCGATDAAKWRYGVDAKTGNPWECCDKCSNIGSVNIPDVFFKGPYIDPHLIDTSKPEQKNGVLIESRRQKAEIMRKLGVREIGDRYKGGRNAL